MNDTQRLRLIGEAAAAEVPDGATIGLGTGSTANAMLRALGQRVREGLTVTGVTTSEATTRLAGDLGIPVVPLDEVESLDLGIDGADEIDPELNLVKGKGGALLYEKLVAERTRRFIVIASSEKLVDQLGTRLPLPVEVVPFGHTHTMRVISSLGLSPVLRLRGDDPVRERRWALHHGLQHRTDRRRGKPGSLAQGDNRGGRARPLHRDHCRGAHS
jgi:ribose 5-phosphate isomerase A